jgi:adenine-specific DNA-methyltransferase
MAKQLQKLELTWIGKGNEPKLEPRILIEDPSKSFGDPKNENMLIHGDNLLALKALEQQFTGKVKCIYIDPPYNTGSAFEHYDDGVEHSQWLSLMKPRLEILRNLLSEDGSIYVSIDNNEMAYLQVLMDEVFQRKNRKNTIIIKRGSVTGAKVINPGLVNISEFILVYTKDANKWNPNRLSRIKDRDDRYGTLIENYNEDFSKWRFMPLLQAFSLEVGIKSTLLKKHFGNEFDNKLLDFIYRNAERVIRFASLDEKSISKAALDLKRTSLENKGVTYFMEREGKRPYFVHNGSIILFVKDRLQEIDGELSFSEPLTDIWDDVLPNDLHNEGGVDFRKGKKPEKLIQRILMLASKQNDIVLDSFLGSGSTAAVAMKMNRQWIGIELGEHANTHCLPRLKSVVEGELRGISKAVNWKGGGGFKFYTLAPSLIQKDKYGTEIINPEYNANMLAAAMAKQEGFRYQPDENNYWKQGMSSEKDFIFTTTQFITVAVLDKLAEELQPNESLLVCCKSFDKGCTSRHANITIKKIPQMLLGRCEFGKDDYSLNIVNLPHDKENEVFIEEHDNEEVNQEDKPNKKTKAKKGRDDKEQPTLF